MSSRGHEFVEADQRLGREPGQRFDRPSRISVHDTTKGGANVTSNVTRPLQSPDANGGCSRRDLLARAGATAMGVGAMLLAACTPGGSARPAGQGRSQTTTPHGPVRLLSVPTVSDGGEWSELLPPFTHQTGIEVKLHIADMDLY